MGNGEKEKCGSYDRVIAHDIAGQSMEGGSQYLSRYPGTLTSSSGSTGPAGVSEIFRLCTLIMHIK